MDNTKQGRLLEIFFRSLRGEDLSVKKLAAEYGVSTKSVSRDIGDLKAFLADHRELAGNTELEYSSQEKCYRLYMDEFLTNKELFALVEVMIGARAFSKEELLTLTGKLKKFTTTEDRPKLNELIRKELYHYAEVKHDCESVQETLWKLVGCIAEKREITIEYYRMDRACKTHRIRPASVMFTDYYFYLIAFLAGEDEERDKPLYFRADRIKRIVEHRGTRNEEETPEFDEGLLRKRSLFMWPGKTQDDTLRILRPLRAGSPRQTADRENNRTQRRQIHARSRSLRRRHKNVAPKPGQLGKSNRARRVCRRDEKRNCGDERAVRGKTGNPEQRNKHLISLKSKDTRARDEHILAQ